MSGRTAWALVIVAVAGCTAYGEHISAEARKNMTPAQLCVDKAFWHSDRVECLKAKPRVTWT